MCGTQREDVYVPEKECQSPSKKVSVSQREYVPETPSQPPLAFRLRFTSRKRLETSWKRSERRRQTCKNSDFVPHIYEKSCLRLIPF